jgi:organic hydroperoxide reductase OsmC/OhrA
MAASTATIRWTRGDQPFTDGRYRRAHAWSFDGGAEVPASSSPGVVPLPLSDPRGVDPEEAFVASLASCHMLWFLSLAAGKGFRVDAYEDEAVGVLGKDAEGRTAMTVVTLRPRVAFSGGKRPGTGELAALHDEAHGRCFIANSVRTEVRCEPREAPPG